MLIVVIFCWNLNLKLDWGHSFRKIYLTNTDAWVEFNLKILSVLLYYAFRFWYKYEERTRVLNVLLSFPFNKWEFEKWTIVLCHIYWLTLKKKKKLKHEFKNT